jgi:FkbM family methyltransferase
VYKHHELGFGDKLVSYAQNAEDMRLYGYFYKLNSPGFYVDIGANHPLHDSVTRFYYLRGWRGINIEPQADLCELLIADRPNDINLAIGLSDKDEQKTLRKYKSDGLSTYSDAYKSSYEAADVSGTKDYIELKSTLTTLDKVLSKYAKRKPIHFLKVDVEGFEYKVLKGNNWKMYRPWVICVESTGRDKRWQKILQTAGYTEHIFDGLNSYFVDKEKYKLIEDYRTFTASEFVRYDLMNTLPIKTFGFAGAARRRLFNRD